MITEGNAMSAAKRSGVSRVVKMKDFFFTLIKNSLEIIKNILFVFILIWY
ncbi:hypothetical protein SDC9_108801 [bioreactor metagenome]|uniref:Uncharacterized protein n=1 Tax=bioreactor metagenome TaxID=1076179 RepID=A0A645B964_9ZZZZ